MTFDPRDNPDPLYAPEHQDRIPSSKPYRLVPDSPRRGCGWALLGWLAMALRWWRG